jgi:glycosyltransferase involved in cell wall biosynthesis
MINPKSVVFFGLHSVGYMMLFKSYITDSAKFIYCSDETYVHWDDISRRVLKQKSMIDRMLTKIFSVVGLRLENASRLSAIHTSSYIERSSSTVFSVFQSNSVLHWGVNLDGCERSERVEEAISIALGGRICIEKGTDVGLNAILLACKERPKQIREVRLLGNIPNDLYGAQILSLITAIRECGVIVTVTIVDSKDVQRQLRECDCFLLPSVWAEPFSIMLVEAMSVGNFCIVSDTGGSSEICKHKVNGYLCDKPTAVEFYAGIMWYLDNRSAAEVIQLEAENTVKGALSMGEMANKFVKLTYSG